MVLFIIYTILLLREQIDENLKNVPRVLAIYKEVEDYYYGDETCEGLKDWDELKLRLDAPHFNPRGHYLQACVWTAALFGVDPTTLSYRPDFLPDSDAKLMRACARDAIADWKE